jgi:phosphopantothenoylcysteine decarboxylase/phosphopantothenate--cysteine ligase
MFPTKIFEKKNILVGVSGGIAAYKTCELIRYLVTNGADVRVMMTKSAEGFITRNTLETLSGNPVYSQLFPEEQFSGTHHVNLADWADAVIIAPATANIIGKAANGIADDFVSTTLLAVHCPVVFAPAMNKNMWNNCAVRRNIKTLEKDNHLICHPAEGFLAEGYSGVGRLARQEYLVQYIYRAVHPSPKSLKNKKVLITAGRTEEALDPVRIFTNRSTGRMGFALAIDAFARGADVVLIHGPSELPNPSDIEAIEVTTAKEMHGEVNKHIGAADILVSAAAIADFMPAKFSKQKIKKEKRLNSVEMSRTKDILEDVGKKKKKGQHLVGFAVETEAVEKNARAKLANKNLDLIAVNNPLEKDAGFAHETNKIALLNRAGGKKDLPTAYKLDVARELFEFLLKSIRK